jgi:hypothetical protein
MTIRRVDFDDEAVPSTACEFSLIGLQLAYINHSQGSKQHQPAHHATNTRPVGSYNNFSRASMPARQCHPQPLQPRERITPAYCTLLLPPAPVRHIAANHLINRQRLLGFFLSSLVSGLVIAASVSPA